MNCECRQRVTGSASPRESPTCLKCRAPSRRAGHLDIAFRSRRCRSGGLGERGRKVRCLSGRMGRTGRIVGHGLLPLRVGWVLEVPAKNGWICNVCHYYGEDSSTSRWVLLGGRKNGSRCLGRKKMRPEVYARRPREIPREKVFTSANALL